MEKPAVADSRAAGFKLNRPYATGYVRLRK